MNLSSTLDVLVIGTGQAGLAMGYHLRDTPLRHQLLDGNARVGDSWRRRYDSLGDSPRLCPPVRPRAGSSPCAASVPSGIRYTPGGWEMIVSAGAPRQRANPTDEGKGEPCPWPLAPKRRA